MAKVLRLHNGGDNITDWQNSNVIGIHNIADIADPEEHISVKEITSVPSPFARIDLVRTAFSEIVDNNSNFELDGVTTYHKMVSDSLDVGELFFNHKRHKDKYEIIYWDKTIDLEELLNSDYEEHNAVGRTMKMFMEQDSKAYNFDKLKRIYLLNYIGPDRPSQMNIIGATSPCTLFFSSANDLGYVTKHISMGQDRPFDDEYCPLYKRDFEFIKYLWSFKASYINFSKDFRIIEAYLELTYKKLTDSQKTTLDAIDKDSINLYDKIDFTDISNRNEVEINGYHLHQRSSLDIINSDFEIDSLVHSGKKPLVLPIEPGNTYESLKYTQDNWVKTDKAVAYDPANLDSRVLPFDGSKYPYLTVSDFLTDTIVKSPFELNDTYYFDGNIESPKGSFLLPITDLFFEFFTVKDLMGTLVGGKKMFELKEATRSVVATIRIPIKGNSSVKYIEYRRSYFEDIEAIQLENKGTLITKVFGLGLFPCVDFKETDKAHYRLPLFDKGEGDIALSFFAANKRVDAKDRVVRREKDIAKDNCSLDTYVVNNKFDRVKVNIGRNGGLVIPKFKNTAGSAKYTFAIDFGTSNTHIEYSVNGSSNSKAFDITDSERQMIRMHTDYLGNSDIKGGFIENNIPDLIGADLEYKLPLRTAFAEHNMIDYNKVTHTLASGNIAFRYEKSELNPHNNVSTDLKWSTDKKERVRLFLANIYLLIRNKVLLNGGDLSATKIVWFYPVSMTEAHCNKFKKIWHELYQEYIGNEHENVITMLESIAPYKFYVSKHGDKSNVVSIDIGGGTTDVYVVENRQPKMLSSFRFAANSIFGDGYGFDSGQNGFVKLFNNTFKDILNANGLNELSSALESIEKPKESCDITSFYFSLSQNQNVINKDIKSLDFTEKLENNTQLKYVFVIFHTAIIYHIAHLMKAKDLQLPLTIAFSGNGSKTLRILSSDKDTLTKYVKLIFEKVYNEKYQRTSDLEIIFEENPKEATCKGGLIAPKQQDFESIDNMKHSLLGIDKHTLVGDIKASKSDSELLDKVVSEVENFINFTFDLNKENKHFFTNKFDADPHIEEQIRELCSMNLREYIGSGVNKQMEEFDNWQEDGNNSDKASERIDETLFFLPIIGMLNNLARNIANN